MSETPDDMKDAADEIAALRARVRHLTEPLPDDPGGRMWSTLNYLASLEGNDLETEVAHWASKSITHLRARVAELEAALREAVVQIEYLHGKFQPTGSGETVLARARRALEPRHD